VLESLLSKHEALSSNSSTIKKKKIQQFSGGSNFSPEIETEPQRTNQMFFQILGQEVPLASSMPPCQL
jgi:hypothetical protein